MMDHYSHQQRLKHISCLFFGSFLELGILDQAKKGDKVSAKIAKVQRIISVWQGTKGVKM